MSRRDVKVIILGVVGFLLLPFFPLLTAFVAYLLVK